MILLLSIMILTTILRLAFVRVTRFATSAAMTVWYVLMPLGDEFARGSMQRASVEHVALRVLVEAVHPIPFSRGKLEGKLCGCWEYVIAQTVRCCFANIEMVILLQVKFIGVLLLA